MLVHLCIFTGLFFKDPCSSFSTIAIHMCACKYIFIPHNCSHSSYMKRNITVYCPCPPRKDKSYFLFLVYRYYRILFHINELWQNKKESILAKLHSQLVKSANIFYASEVSKLSISNKVVNYFTGSSLGSRLLRKLL